MSNNNNMKKMYMNNSIVGVVSFTQGGGMAIPDNIETWTLDAYGRPTSIELKNGVTSIPDNWQSNNTVLSSVTIPSTVTIIGTDAFSNSDLRSIVVPSGVTTIGNRAFYGIGNISSITVANTVTTVGNSTFGGMLGSGYSSVDVSNIDLSNVMNLYSSLFASSYVKGNLTISNNQLSGATSGGSYYGVSMFNNCKVSNSADTLSITVYADGRVIPSSIFSFSTSNVYNSGKVNVTIYGTPTYLSKSCFGGTSGCSVTFVDCTTPPEGSTATGSNSPFYNFNGTVYVPSSVALTRWKNKYSNYSSIFKVIGT